MPKGSFWQPKLQTAAAMARLCHAQMLVSLVPFNRWSGGLGLEAGEARLSQLDEGRQLAADVEWAAKRLPFTIKCLPRAMALSWKLRQRCIGHALVVAARPQQHRQESDSLHAWIELRGERIIGDLPGPWVETMRLGS